jgi:hypothetical protein
MRDGRRRLEGRSHKDAQSCAAVSCIVRFGDHYHIQTHQTYTPLFIHRSTKFT